MSEQNEVHDTTEEEVLATGEPPIEGTPEPTLELNAEQRKMILEKVRQFAATEGTPPDTELPAEEAKDVGGPPPMGKDVDWNEYDLDYSVRHLYPQSSFRMTQQGPKWVVLLDEFVSVECAFGSHGKKVGPTGTRLNVGEYLNDMLNGSEGWKLISLLPAGMGRVGVLLRRDAPLVLPDPVPLKKETEVEAPRDPELQKEEDSALAFMAGEGLVPPTEDAPVGDLVAQALSINPPTERDPMNLRILGGLDAEPPMAPAAGEEAEVALRGEDFGEVPGETA